ncbi:HPP family protein [Achromobacter sp. GG226]|uniref:HPP family protein n=1 Tax=Verticiella alkaliphila TaxID=2779529 RepID=UPI001C0C4539|nr:HPP family protein [Verticiella sp. GG226]MBU4609800.1 HPP family protein [Verticiella sp. GG226]
MSQPPSPPLPPPQGEPAAAPPRWWSRLIPARLAVDARERARAITGAGLGLFVVALLCRWWVGADSADIWIAAPLGASAVLIFATPASPLAQPWSVIGGNTLSALVGVACGHLIADPAGAGALSVALAIAVMFLLRCLHPPGGATALLSTLSLASAKFALFPMLTGSVLLVLAGMAYNPLTGRRYPHAQTTAPSRTPTRFTDADLDQALDSFNQVLDVSRQDLKRLLHLTEAAAFRRSFGALQARDIMSQPPITIAPRDSLADAWSLMRRHRIKALPVADAHHTLVGIITTADFMRYARPQEHEGLARRLRGVVARRGRSLHTPDTVGEIMTRHVRVASEDRPLQELVEVFSEGGHHHIPIIDARRRIVGMMTESDLMRALYRALQPGG